MLHSTTVDLEFSLFLSSIFGPLWLNCAEALYHQLSVTDSLLSSFCSTFFSSPLFTLGNQWTPILFFTIHLRQCLSWSLHQVHNLSTHFFYRLLNDFNTNMVMCVLVAYHKSVCIALRLMQTFLRENVRTLLTFRLSSNSPIVMAWNSPSPRSAERDFYRKWTTSRRISARSVKLRIGKTWILYRKFIYRECLCRVLT